MLSQRKWTFTVHVLVYLTSSRRWMEIIIFLIFDVYKETMVIWSIDKFTCNRHWVTAGPTGCRLKKADPVVTRWEMRVLLTPLPFLVNEKKTSNLPSSPSCMWSWPSIQLGNIKYHHTTEFFSVTRYVSVYDLTMCVNTCLLYLVQPMEPATQWSKVKDALVFFLILKYLDEA